MAVEATTQQEIEDLLHAEHLKVDYGAELLDTSDVLQEDISDDLQEAGYVDHNNYAQVHGTCELVFPREFDWKTARVRPYAICTGAGYWKRWNLGVYLITSPQTQLGEIPISRKVAGKDKISLLAQNVGDNYFVAASTGYLAAVRTAIEDSEVTGLEPLLDGTAEASTVSEDMVWPLDPAAPPTWLGIVNDLLAAVGYRGLYANRDGRFCSEPYKTPSERNPSWTFDVTDEQRQMVAEERKLAIDEADKTNHFTFIRSNMAAKPVSGSGLYIVDNSGSDPEYPRTWWLNVEGQTELEAEGDRIIEQMAQRKETITFPCSPAPLLWHFDVLDYHDLTAGGYLKGQVMNWRLPLDRSDMNVQMEVVS